MSTHQPPAPPPPPPPKSEPQPGRPWWQFSLKSLLIATTGLAAFFGVGSIAPMLTLGLVNLAMIPGFAGLVAGGIFHDWDRARLAAIGALGAVVFSRDRTGVSDSLFQFAANSGWIDGSWNGATISLVSGLPALAEAVLYALIGAIVAVKSAPRWHRWAARSK